MIGGLLYLTNTKLDIMYAVCLAAKFQQEPKQSHVVTIKRIFRYLKGTKEFGLWYPRSSYFTLIYYIDADWVKCIDDQKSISRGAFFLDPRLVAWSSKKKDSVSLSTVEAEYIVASSCCTHILWMRQTLKDIGVNFDDPISIMCNNTSAINISKNPVQHSRTKYISIRYHFLRENVLDNEVRLEYVSIKEQIVDIFTKELCKDTFEYLWHKLGVLPLSNLN